MAPLLSRSCTNSTPSSGSGVEMAADRAAFACPETPTRMASWTFQTLFACCGSSTSVSLESFPALGRDLEREETSLCSIPMAIQP